MPVLEAPGQGQEFQAKPQTGEVSGELRPIRVGDVIYQTDLPEGIYPFEAKDGLGSADFTSLPLNINELDKIPVGSYKVSYFYEADFRHRLYVTDEEKANNKREMKREIVILDGAKGKVVSRSSFTDFPPTQLRSAELMRSLGYEAHEQGIRRLTKYDAIPTPHTFKAAADEQGINIKLLPEYGVTPHKEYFGAFAEGAYPVATGEEEYYLHDISDDHVTGILLGGKLFQDALKPAAQAALKLTNRDDIEKAVKRFDNLTTQLRSAIGCIGEFEEAAAATYRGMFLRKGLALGISEDTLNKIFENATKKARTLDLIPEVEE